MLWRSQGPLKRESPVIKVYENVGLRNILPLSHMVRAVAMIAVVTAVEVTTARVVLVIAVGQQAMIVWRPPESKEFVPH